MESINLMKNGNMYFMISDRRAHEGDKIWITTGMETPIQVGTEVEIESFTGIVEEITEERPMANSETRTFQKLNILITKKYTEARLN